MKPSEPRRKQNSKTEASRKIDGDGGADRFERIAIAAYFRAEARGFAPGQAMDDWLRAEAEVDRGVAA